MNAPLPFRIHPDDRSFPMHERVGICLCSRCGDPIDQEGDEDTPLWLWGETRCYRYHWRCAFGPALPEGTP